MKKVSILVGTFLLFSQVAFSENIRTEWTKNPDSFAGVLYRALKKYSKPLGDNAIDHRILDGESRVGIVTSQSHLICEVGKQGYRVTIKIDSSKFHWTSGEVTFLSVLYKALKNFKSEPWGKSLFFYSTGRIALSGSGIQFLLDRNEGRLITPEEGRPFQPISHRLILLKGKNRVPLPNSMVRRVPVSRMTLPADVAFALLDRSVRKTLFDTLRRQGIQNPEIIGSSREIHSEHSSTVRVAIANRQSNSSASAVVFSIPMDYNAETDHFALDHKRSITHEVRPLNPLKLWGRKVTLQADVAAILLNTSVDQALQKARAHFSNSGWIIKSAEFIKSIRGRGQRGLGLDLIIGRQIHDKTTQLIHLTVEFAHDSSTNARTVIRVQTKSRNSGISDSHHLTDVVTRLNTEIGKWVRQLDSNLPEDTELTALSERFATQFLEAFERSKASNHLKGRVPWTRLLNETCQKLGFDKATVDLLNPKRLSSALSKQYIAKRLTISRIAPLIFRAFKRAK